jgi:hypothetical protein
MKTRSWAAGLVTVILLSSVGMTLNVAASAQACEPIPNVTDNGCTGCTTTITLTCESLGADCLGCHYEVFASIACPPTVHVVTGDANIECGGKFERRFGGCGSGPAWGCRLLSV